MIIIFDFPFDPSISSGSQEKNSDMLPSDEEIADLVTKRDGVTFHEFLELLVRQGLGLGEIIIVSSLGISDPEILKSRLEEIDDLDAPFSHLQMRPSLISQLHLPEVILGDRLCRNLLWEGAEDELRVGYIETHPFPPEKESEEWKTLHAAIKHLPAEKIVGLKTLQTFGGREVKPEEYLKVMVALPLTKGQIISLAGHYFEQAEDFKSLLDECARTDAPFGLITFPKGPVTIKHPELLLAHPISMSMLSLEASDGLIEACMESESSPWSQESRPFLLKALGKLRSHPERLEAMIDDLSFKLFQMAFEGSD